MQEVDIPCNIAYYKDESNAQAIINLIREDKAVINGIKVRAADLSKLTEILIESFDQNGHVLPNTGFPRVFFLMHKWFIESEDLANLLIEQFGNIRNAVNECKNQETSKLGKICHAIQYWISNFPFHFVVDSKLVNVIRTFSSIAHEANLENVQLIDMSNIGSYNWMRKLTVKRNSIRAKGSVSLAFNKLGPDVLATQLTYLEWKTLRRISFSDYKSYVCRGSVQNIPPLEKSIQLFNGLSQWIQCMILSKTTPKERADIIHKFVEVAKQLRKLQNFNTLMAVIGGICHSSIARLSKTNIHLSICDQKTLHEYMELLSSNCNYAHYRKVIIEINNFWIPIIGIHLKDMISLHTAHLDKLDNNLINFRKMAQLSVIFQNLTDLQKSPPPVQENSDLIKLLQLTLNMNYTEDEIYELSLAREPRTSVSSPPYHMKFPVVAEWAKNLPVPPDPKAIQKDVNAMVNAVFKNYDHDADGCISHDEFLEIAQNFPFIDAFATLDSNKDGLISKNEMKTYFLRANYQALKSEFKHDFQEITYFKLTYCSHCDGLLWGIIKQGWRCKGCGINVHRDCRDWVVMECRTKKPSSADIIRKRSSLQRKSNKIKEILHPDMLYGDHSMSDDNDSNDGTHENMFVGGKDKTSIDENRWDSDKLTHMIKQGGSAGRFRSKFAKPFQDIDGSKRFTKFSKRRKSLPSGSSNEEHHPIALIPRGPLICSNTDNLKNWLPNSSTQNESANKPTINPSEQTTSKSDNDDKNEERLDSDEVFCTSKTLASRPRNLTIGHLPESLNYDMNIIKTAFYNATPPVNNHLNPAFSPCHADTNNRMANMILKKNVRRIGSDSRYNDFVGYSYLDDDIVDESSTEDEKLNIMKRLIEAENERQKLENENITIKKQLKAANEQIDCLKKEISSMRNDNLTSHSQNFKVTSEL